MSINDSERLSFTTHEGRGDASTTLHGQHKLKLVKISKVENFSLLVIIHIDKGLMFLRKFKIGKISIIQFSIEPEAEEIVHVFDNAK